MQTTAAIIHSNKCGGLVSDFGRGLMWKSSAESPAAAAFTAAGRAHPTRVERKNRWDVVYRGSADPVSGMQWSPEVSSLLALGAVT